MSVHTENEIKIPQEQIDSLAASFYPVILKFFESEEDKLKSAEWKSKKDPSEKASA